MTVTENLVLRCCASHAKPRSASLVKLSQVTLRYKILVVSYEFGTASLTYNSA